MPDVSAGIVAMGPVSGAGDTAVNLPAPPPVSQQFVILTDSSFLSYRQLQLFASNRTGVDARFLVPAPA
ncbi:TPA: hypothetical protein JLR02_002629 [Escherichia coli]|nr:hypothetical protein [Escherichia coli]